MKSGIQHGQVFFLVADPWLLHVPSGWEDEERALWGPFNKDTKPIYLIHLIHEGSILIT